MKTKIFMVSILVVLVARTVAWGDPISKEIYYQKKTTLSYPATRTLRFSLWLTETGGADPIWSEEKKVKMNNAYVKTYLGDTTLFDTVPVDFSQQYWVQVERKKKDGSYVLVGLRDPLGVVPYALFSESSIIGSGDITSVSAGTGLTGGGTSGDVSLAVNTTVIQNRVTGSCPAGQSIRVINADGTVSCEADDVGTGDITGVAAGVGLTGGGTSGDVALSVSIPLVLTASDTNALIQGINSGTGPGLHGENTMVNGGVHGVLGTTHSGYGSGVYGQALAVTGWATGVRGISASANGTGVIGRASTTTGLAWGVTGVSDSTGGVGVAGYASATTGYTSGVNGRSDSSSGIGVTGYTYASTGITTGVYGESFSTEGRGVVGKAITPTGETYGVYAESASTSGYGVSGHATATTGSATGVRGMTNSDEGYAGYFEGGRGVQVVGNLDVTGNLTKGSGSFVQPHPVDPEKEVVYAFFEGPEHAIFLRGRAKLIEGQAIIETPEYFRVVAGDAEHITVQFTPRSTDTFGLAAIEVTREKILVQELKREKHTYEFDYFITAKRAGFEQHRPIQPNSHFSADKKTKEEFERTYSKTDDMTVRAMRTLLISNGILTEDGKLNTEVVEKLGWRLKESDFALKRN